MAQEVGISTSSCAFKKHIYLTLEQLKQNKKLAVV